MIYPTRRSVLLAAAGAPVALVASTAMAELWLIGPAWVALTLMLAALDAHLGGARGSLSLQEPGALQAEVARGDTAVFVARFEKGRTPTMAEAALDAGRRLGLADRSVTAAFEGRVAHFAFDFTPERRGEATLDALWVRWRGPLGLVWKQKVFALGLPARVGVALRSVREEAVRLFSRNALFGAKTQLEVGEGSEFHALQDFQAGMDPRAVDWKQSARHAALLAKEFRTERNHHVIMALDCGRAMSEPMGGAPRLDRAINAALLLAYACLKSGDRAGLFAFDSAPRLNTGALAGPSAFRMLQQTAGRIDYSTEEANYTLGLTALAGTLKRRSLVVAFTDFTDSTAAELMIESLGRLLRRHLVLFVVLRDADLENLLAAEPVNPDDVARAVVAAALQRERDIVIARLRHMGVHIVEAPADRLGPAILNAYLDLKRRDLL